MQPLTRENYRGYSLEAVKAAPSGWWIAIFRRSIGLPDPSHFANDRHPTPDDALAAGRSSVDKLLAV